MVVIVMVVVQAVEEVVQAEEQVHTSLTFLVLGQVVENHRKVL
ncbi:MAG: hypothetical protein ACK55Z_01525 [bacterium]